MHIAKLFDSTNNESRFDQHHAIIESSERRAQLCSFLDSGAPIVSARSNAPDFWQSERGNVVSTVIYTDGEWIWTAAQSYYLREYGLAPEPDFESYIESKDFVAQAPSESEISEALSLLKQHRRNNAISPDKAYDLVKAHLSNRSNDEQTTWHLEEFNAGWIVRMSHSSDAMGAASIVVEKASGQLKTFPSSVPPRRIVDDYDSIKDRGVAK